MTFMNGATDSLIELRAASCGGGSVGGSCRAICNGNVGVDVRSNRGVTAKLRLECSVRLV